MQFSKSALLAFTTLAITATVQGAVISGPAQERSIVDNGANALDLRSLDLAEQSLNAALVERDPRKTTKKASTANVARVKSGASSIKAATSELRKFRAAHKKAKKSRDLNERAKAQNVADLRKSLRKVNKHLLTAASQLRQVNKRDEGALNKRVLGPITDIVPTLIPTDIVPTDIVPTDIIPTDIVPTDVIPTDVLPTDIIPTGVIPTDIIPTDIIPTGVIPTDIIPTDIIPTGVIPTDIIPTDILPTSIIPTDIIPTDIIPTLTVPTLTLPTPTTTTPVGGNLAAIIAAIRALVALIREFVQELVATILDIFTGGSTDTSVLSEVAPGVNAVFGATTGLARDISPSVGNSVSSALNRVQAVLARYGVKA